MHEQPQDRPETETSFKPLTVSSTPSTPSTTDQGATLKSYAAKRARLLFGCYRKGDANDPDTYVAAITAVLSRFPEDVIKHVTHPAKGLPIRTDFLPTVAEVHRACEAIMTPRREATAREARVKKQLAERDEQFTPRTSFARDSAEARAVKVLHEIVDRSAAFFAIFRRDDGSVIYTKPMTPQLLALAKAKANAEWVTLTREQAASWEEMLRTFFERAMVRKALQEGSRAPWHWPPGADGRIYPTASGPPQMPE